MRELRISEAGVCENDAPVLPLWIDGHAYLTVTPVFGVVRRGNDGAPLRRYPLCGAVEVERACGVAASALVAWAAIPAPRRHEALSHVAEALENYRQHFAALLVEDGGAEIAQATHEIDRAIAELRQPLEASASGVVGIAGDPQQPFASVVARAASALAGGAVVVLASSAGAPSVLFALAELTGRAGWPTGVFNLLHGDATLLGEFEARGLPMWCSAVS